MPDWNLVDLSNEEDGRIFLVKFQTAVVSDFRQASEVTQKLTLAHR